MDLIIQAGVQNKYAALFSASTSKRVNELRHKFRKISLTSAQINFHRPSIENVFEILLRVSAVCPNLETNEVNLESGYSRLLFYQLDKSM